MQLIVLSDGSIRCLYGEELELAKLGSVKISRVSYVEPDCDGNWTADLVTVQGPLLGPFRSRSEALASERLWLEAHWLTKSR